MKSPTFGKSYSSRNILPRFIGKSPTFGKSYSTRNTCMGHFQRIFGYFTSETSIVLVNHTVVEIFHQDLYILLYKSPSFDKSYSTRNIEHCEVGVH